MLFDQPIAPETYALIRFGTGLPAADAPVSPKAMLKRLAGPDRIAKRYPYLPYTETLRLTAERREARLATRSSMDRSAFREANLAVRDAFVKTLRDDLRRGLDTDDPFRERLVAFWANHFTARSKTEVLRTGHAGYIGEAIRPHVTGRFGDMLKAIATHPFMLYYLDQRISVGPNSPAGLERGRGLNENFARELLELHTLGVGGGYTQRDVRQLAELLTGLGSNDAVGFRFRDRRAEPGAEEVLGQTYGGGPATLDDIYHVLDDLALHPSTARHLARKLATHFISDVPDADLVDELAAVYRVTDGDLMAMYEALLAHPAAWQGFGGKVKQPFEFILSALRALRVSGQALNRLPDGVFRRNFMRALSVMGQPYAEPPGPDGWADTEAAWVTPHSLAARIGWAKVVGRALRRESDPDPRKLVTRALGDAAGTALIQAAHGAETRAEGVMLVLASPEFNRR